MAQDPILAVLGEALCASGATIFFSTSAGSLSSGISNGSKVMATTNSCGVASVTLTLPSATLPSAAQPVTVTDEGAFGLGHPMVTFNETSQ
jgi:hypothetical protein